MGKSAFVVLFHMGALLTAVSFADGLPLDFERGFAKLCQDRKLGFETRYTVRTLLLKAQVDPEPTALNCGAADAILSANTELDLSYQGGIVDPSPLTNFSKLLAVRFFRSPRLDLESLAKNPYLKSLGFYFSAIADVEALGNMRQLESLSIDAAGVLTRIQGLERTNLKRIQFLTTNGAHSAPTDWADLGHVTSLEEIQAEEVVVPSLDFASKLVNLKSMQINATFDGPSRSRYEDLSPLASCLKLGELGLGAGNVRSLEPLYGLKDLTGLAVVRNKVTSVLGIDKLQSLVALRLTDNFISEVAPLARLKHLEYLDLSGNPVRDLSPLAENIDLRTLVLENVPNIDPAPLEGLVRPHLNRHGETVSLKIQGVRERVR